LFVQAFAPFVVASAVETLSDRMVLLLGTVLALAVLLCFVMIKTPGIAARR
jgi:hypothetical protein